LNLRSASFAMACDHTRTITQLQVLGHIAAF